MSSFISFDSERLSISYSPQLDHHLSLLSQSIDDYSGEQSKFQFYQRSLARQKQSQQAYLAKRAADNEVRVMQGQQPIEEDLSKLPLFKPLNKPSRLDTYLIAASMRNVLKGTEKILGVNLEKPSIIEAVHRQEGRGNDKGAAAETTSSTDTV